MLVVSPFGHPSMTGHGPTVGGFGAVMRRFDAVNWPRQGEALLSAGLLRPSGHDGSWPYRRRGLAR